MKDVINKTETEDVFLTQLQKQLFICCDDLGPVGCDACSEQKVCERKWLGVQAKKNNGTILTPTEYWRYKNVFSEIRYHRQTQMVLPAKHGVDTEDGAGAERNK